jgi:glycosyltransferase involved in cell wall biosynthesis
VTGLVGDALPYIGAADVLVLSSRREGLPTVVIEALAARTPVVATDCPSGPREILDGGRLGHLVPVGDAEALAAAMVDALSAPRAFAGTDDLVEYTLDGAMTKYGLLLAGMGVGIDSHD